MAIVGSIGEDIESAYEIGVAGIFSINRAPIPFSEAKELSARNLWLTMDNLWRFSKATGAFEK